MERMDLLREVEQAEAEPLLLASGGLGPCDLAVGW